MTTIEIQNGSETTVETIELIDLTPTWQKIVPLLIEVAKDSEPAREELMRLAKYADNTPALLRHHAVALRRCTEAMCRHQNDPDSNEDWDGIIAEADALLGEEGSHDHISRQEHRRKG